MTNATNTTKRQSVIETEIVGGELHISCINGERIKLNPSDMSFDIKTQAELHGYKQKLIDAAAISRNPETGRAATPDDKWAALMTVYRRITGDSPQWNATRGEGGAGTGGLLYRALCQLYPNRTPEQIREFLAGQTPAAQAALRKNARVSAIIDELRAGDGKDNSEELLAGLED